MILYSGTGVTTTGTLKCNKSAYALHIASSLAFSALTGNEKINIQVERPSGSNVFVAVDIPLIDFLCEATYGVECINNAKEDGFKFVAKCELTDGEGAYLLQQGENILVTLSGLAAADTWQVGIFEHPLKSTHLKVLERKTVASEDVTKIITVDAYKMAVINDTNNTVTDYLITFSNGQQISYKPFELRTLMKDIDAVSYISDSGVVIQYAGRICLPLTDDTTGLFITQIEVRKTQGNVVNFLLSNVDYRN